MEYSDKYLKTDSIENSLSTQTVEIKFDKFLNNNSFEIKKTATFESSNDFNVNTHTENDENINNAQIVKGQFGADSKYLNKNFQKYIRRKTNCLRKDFIFRSKDPLRRSRSYDTIYLNGVKSSLNSWLNFQMADDSIDDECAKVNKLSDIKRSLSSWSLSAIKKHRLSTPRFAGVTLFQGKKKVTSDEEKPSSPSSRKVQLLKDQRQKIKNRFKKDSSKASPPSTEASPITNGTETIEKYKNHNDTSKVCDSVDKITFIDDEEDSPKKNAKTPSGDVARDSLMLQDMYADQWWDADDHSTSEKEKKSHEIKNERSLNPFYEDADLSSVGEKSSLECKDNSIYADMETVSGQMNGVVSPVVMKEQFKDPRYGSDKEESSNLEKKMELARSESIRKTIKVKTKIGFGGIVDSLSETFRKNDLILAFSPTAIASKSRAKKDEIDDSLDEDTVNYYKKQSDELQSDNSSGSDWKKSIYSTMHPKENCDYERSIADNRVEKEIENQTNIIFKIEDLGEQNSLKYDATDMEVPSVVDLRSEIENDEKKTNMKEISKTLKSFTDSIFKEKGNRNAADNRKKYMLGGIMNSNSKFATKYLESKNSRLDPSAFPKIIVTPSSFDESSSSVESPNEIINQFEKNSNNDSDNTKKANNLPDFDVILNESNTNLDALKDDNMTEGSSCFQSVMDDQQNLVQDLDHTEEYLRDNDDDNETTFFSVSNSVYGKNDGYSSESDLEILKKVGIIRSESDTDVLELSVKERYSSPFGSSKASSSETLANVTLSSEDTLNNESNAKSKSQNDNDLDSILLDCSLKKCENISDIELSSNSIDCTSEVKSQSDDLIQPHLQYHLSAQTVSSEDDKTMIIEKPSIEVSSVPKPSPRTKKGKGIYQSKVELLHESSFDLQKVTSSSSNYNDTDLKDTDTGENIYCEIGEPKPNGPRPTPRSRKNKRENNYRGSCSSVVNIDSKSSSSSVTLNSSQKSIPDWIAKRSPIPCPRKQKQSSLASLPAALINETPKSVLPNQSPVRKVTMKGSEPTAWEGDDFYYGKAASIAYGISSHHTSQPPSTDSGIFCQVENHYEFIGEKNKQTMAGTNKVDIPDGGSVAITKGNSVDIPNVNRNDTPDGNKVSTRDLVEEVASPLQKPVRKRNKTVTKSDNIVQTVTESTDRKGRDSLQQLFFGSLGAAPDASASVDRTESLLVEVLYAIHNIAGSTPASTWLLYHDKLASINGFPPPNGGASSPPSPRKVTFGDVCSNLQETFGVEEQMLVKCLDQAKRMERMQLQLRVKILSARDLRMKSVDGTANPYVTISVPGDCHRTKLLHQTRAPVWDQTFSLRVHNMQRDSLKLDIWHEYKHQGVGAVKEVKDLKALGRLMKGSKAQERHLLGTVNIDLKDILEDGICGWFPLVKDEQNLSPSHLSGSTSNLSSNGDNNFTTSISNQLAHFKQSGAALLHHSTGDSSSTHPRNEQKQRGEIYLSANWSASRPVPSGVKRPYDALFAKNMIAYLKDLQPGRIWGGSLPPGSLCSLHLLSVVEGISGGQKALTIWNIASRAGLAVDNGWLLELLEIIEKNLKNNNYTTEEKRTLSDSLKSWFEESEYRLSHLEESFSQSAGVTHSHQLSYLLKSLKLISNSSDFQSLVLEGGKDGPATFDVTEVVKRAIEKYATAWWINLLERELKDSLSPEEQVKRVINITDECYLLIASATSFYSPVIVSEVNVPYLRIIYLFITKKLNPCVRPLLMNVYNRLLSSHSPHEDSEAKSDYALSAGTDLWQLYINLGRIHKQGQNMPQEVRQESGVRDYHRWFSKGVMHWLQVAQTRIQKIITNAVSADHLTPCDEYCDFSSSATDAITVFIGVRNWWLELSWPDIQNSCVLLGKILEDLCSSATFYCDQLKDKVHHIYTAQKNDKKVFITKQICIGLNNIERVRDEVAKLPDHFKISDILKELSKSSNTPNPFSCDAEEDGKAAADHFRGTFERIVSSASENMEMKVTEFVDTVTEKVTDIVSNGLTAACEASDPSLLLVEVLDPGLGLMRNSLQKKNFERFLDKFWNILLSLIRNVVDRNVERRNSSFFEGVFEILTSSLQFFTPLGGLAVEEAMNEDYYKLVERLELLRLSSECLISQYYRQRSREEEACKGELFVTVFFTRSQKLVVEVVMAKNMKGDDDNRSSLANPGSHLPIDPYVKIQLVPQEWFPGALTNSTKVLKKSDPATFQETFSYVLSPEDSNVSESFLLFTLKDHNLARSNTFIGESLVSLGSVPLIESDSIMSQPKPLTLKLTKPGIEAGYKAINTLRHRSTTTDRVASAFMKKVGARFADARGRKESRDNNHLHGGSTDDEKTPGGRSPKLLDKLKMKIEIT